MTTGFTVSKKECSKGKLLTFTAGESVSVDQFKEFLGILDTFLDKKIKFAFVVDTSTCHNVPHVQVGILLVKWMKKRKPDIPGYLLGSSIVLRSKIITSLVNKAFSIQRPTSPNLITTEPKKATDFLDTILNGI